MKNSVKVGLQLWLVFVTSLFLLGYPALFSLIVAAIAGAAGSFIATWISNQGDASPKQNKALTQLRKQLGLTGEGKDNKVRRRSKRTYPGLFGLGPRQTKR
ncbi:MAG: hypothetical protein ACFE0I_06005 [Elainellaceae cyanobacterium]